MESLRETAQRMVGVFDRSRRNVVGVEPKPLAEDPQGMLDTARAASQGLREREHRG